MAERIWTSRDQGLLTRAIGRELLARLASDGKRLKDLSDPELANARYRLHLDFMYGTSGEGTRAKQARFYAALDAEHVPALDDMRIVPAAVEVPHLGQKIADALLICPECGAPLDMHDDGECPPTPDIAALAA